jgi:hypothetical protein
MYLFEEEENGKICRDATAKVAEFSVAFPGGEKSVGLGRYRRAPVWKLLLE